jgi:hypothetical protein
MAGMSDWLEAQVLNWALRPGSQVDMVQPSQVFAALYVSAPGEAGGGTEISTGSYVRQPITIGADGKNSATVTFPTATADWGTVTACALFDAETSGHMLFYGNLSVSRLVKTGDVFKFEAQNLTVTVD